MKEVTVLFMAAAGGFLVWDWYERRKSAPKYSSDVHDVVNNMQTIPNTKLVKDTGTAKPVTATVPDQNSPANLTAETTSTTFLAVAPVSSPAQRVNDTWGTDFALAFDGSNSLRGW